jgi:hypothetical protein
MATPRGDSRSERPEFAVTLGLLPPYTLDDVKRAYLAKVKSAHPDHGGARADFDKIQHAFEQANAYLSFRGDRRQWIAARMEQYVAVTELVERLRQLGAEVDTAIVDWIKHSFGDFANLTESITSIKKTDADASELLDSMIRERELLSGLKRLNLAGCPLNDPQALQLRVFSSLVHLDLSRTQITARSTTALIERLTQLETFKIEGTSIGWWARRQLRRKLQRRQMPQLAAVIHALNTS